MNNKHPDPGFDQQPHKVPDEAVLFVVINTQTMLYRNGDRYRILHCFYPLRYALGLKHQASTKCAALNTGRRTTAIQVDFVIPPAFGQFRTAGQGIRLTAPQLYRYWVFGRVEIKMAASI